MRVVGYYTNWSQYRGGDLSTAQIYKYYPESVPITLLTHICFAFAFVSDKAPYEVVPTEWNDVRSNDPSQGMYYRMKQHIRKHNPNCKMIISIGGWSFNSKEETRHIFGKIASTAESRHQFAESCVRFCHQHGFDGVDIDWEYPNYPDQGGQIGDKENYTLLLAELHKAFASKLELSIAIPASPYILNMCFEWKLLHQYCDFISIMCYDMSGVWEKKTNPQSPLFHHEPCGSHVIQRFLQAGTPSQKLVLGIPFYGKSFKLDSQCTGSCEFGLPIEGAGRPGPVTHDAGTLAHYEIVQLLRDHNTRFKMDHQTMTCVLQNKDLWVSFDNERTIQLKGQYVKENKLGGVMTWALDMDDVTRNSPLLQALRNSVQFETV